MRGTGTGQLEEQIELPKHHQRQTVFLLELTLIPNIEMLLFLLSQAIALLFSVMEFQNNKRLQVSSTA
jgi:hypothetical protein